MDSKDSTAILELNNEIKARKDAEKALIRSREELRQAKKMEALGTLVAGMAHEINNPVNLIIYNMPVMEKVWRDFMPIFDEYVKIDPDKTYGGLTFDFIKKNLIQLIADVDMAANRIAKIVSDLKKFARESHSVEKALININDAVENAIRLSKKAIADSGVDLEIDLCDDLPLIDGNLQNIEQIVVNIILNGIEAMDHCRGKGILSVSTGYRYRDGKIYILVSDTGTGIDASISKNIFDPFVTNKHDRGGTGLGLSITYNLVKAHNGEIGFTANKNKGTDFIVSFPTTKTDKAARILIVDDDASIRMLLKEAFSRNKAYLVDEASNGVDACIKLGTYKPHIVILDIFMPQMDGVEVCRTLKNDPALSDIKVIITTGYTEHEKLKEIDRMGFANVYHKPIKIKKLMDDVERLLSMDEP